MNGRKLQLREFRNLKDVGRVKYENNEIREIKGYNMIMDEEFTVVKLLMWKAYNIT